MLYVCCVLALAAGGGVLGFRLLETGSAGDHVHAAGPSGLGVPVRTSFGALEVESVEQIRGLTPKALSGVTHGIHSLVSADEMQVQLVLALRDERNRAVAYDPAAFQLRLGRKRYESVTTSVRAGRLAPRSSMETTLGFVIPRFNPRGTRLTLEFRERGRVPVVLDLGRVRPGGSLEAVRAALQAGHRH
jgi:hypothetical protein